MGTSAERGLWPRARSGLAHVVALRPPLNFITIHYAYFIIVCLVASLVFWGSSNPTYSISYVDSLFLVVSAMTEAGLNTVNLSQMTTWQQVLLVFLIVIGSQIWVSIWTVMVRKHAFERRFKEIVQKERRKQLTRQGTGLSMLSRQSSRRGTSRTQIQLPIEEPSPRIASTRPDQTQSADAQIVTNETSQNESSPPADRPPTPPVPVEGTSDAPASPRILAEHITFAVATDHGRRPDGLTRRHGRPTSARPPGSEEKSPHELEALSRERRDELGGTEYRALRILSIVVPAYFFVWQSLGCIALGAWIANNMPQPAYNNAVSPWWNGIFNGLSAFNNSGMSVLDLNMIPYQNAYFVQVVMGALILAGNTAYPIFLRLGFWTSLKVLNWVADDESYVGWKKTLEYILEHPRRVYTNMFGSQQTWWLLFMLVLLNGIDWVAYEILNLGNAQLEQIPVGSRVINGLFQAVAVRAGGFYIVPIPILYIGLQVLYVVMMYISAYPVVITMRHSNIYQERSLGIYNDSDVLESPLQRSLSVTSRQPRGAQRRSSISRVVRGTLPEWTGVGAQSRTRSRGRESTFRDIGPLATGDTSGDFIRHQIRSQLSHDLWLIVLAVLVITIIETQHFLEDPVNYSVFNILFEVVSGYGCVGISIGVPWNAFSFSGGWYPGSKLVLALVMLRGRHRGLPVALDRAVQLPSDDIHEVEEQEDLRLRRSMSVRGSMWEND